MDITWKFSSKPAGTVGEQHRRHILEACELRLLYLADALYMYKFDQVLDTLIVFKGENELVCVHLLDDNEFTDR